MHEPLPRRGLLAALLLVLAACNPPEEEVEVPWTAPDAPGPWTASTEVFETTGSSGVALTIQVWYPASQVDDELYVYDDWMMGGAYEDGIPDCAAHRPVVLFSHGNMSFRYQSFFLTEHLARHGYVVVAPDHFGNTLDNNTLPAGELAIRRPRDIVDTFDWLLDHVADADSLLYDCIHPEAGYALTGHSFGGYTTLATAGATIDVEGLLAACATSDSWMCNVEEYWSEHFPGEVDGDLSDDRVWAAAPMSPAGRFAFGEGLADIEVPTLVMGGLLDDITPWEAEVRPIYQLLATTPRYLAGLEDAGHFTFSDFCVPGFNGCNPGDLPLEVAHPLLTSLVQAHFDVARGEDRARPWLPPESDVLVWESVER
jgi:predicted dienelactone hydrolase